MPYSKADHGVYSIATALFIARKGVVDTALAVNENFSSAVQSMLDNVAYYAQASFEVSDYNVETSETSRLHTFKVSNRGFATPYEVSIAESFDKGSGALSRKLTELVRHCMGYGDNRDGENIQDLLANDNYMTELDHLGVAACFYPYQKS